MFRDDWQWKTSKVFCFLSKAKRGMMEMDGLISSRSPPKDRTNNDLALGLLSVHELYPSLHHSVLVPGRLCVDLGHFPVHSGTCSRVYALVWWMSQTFYLCARQIKGFGERGVLQPRLCHLVLTCM